MPPNKDLFLAIHVGTGSVRAALTDLTGQIVAFHSAEHDQQVPHFGWSQQRPSDWWRGVVLCIRAVLDKIENAAARCMAPFYWTRKGFQSSTTLLFGMISGRETCSTNFSNDTIKKSYCLLPGIPLLPLGRPSSCFGFRRSIPMF